MIPLTQLTPLPRTFYVRSALIIARELLGARLIRQEAGGRRIVGRIVETEAYTGLDDAASHSHRGMTRRNAPMWEEPGHAYIYSIHGAYWMLNMTVEPEGKPAAVLIRAVEPLEGLDIIAVRRTGRKPLEWTSGPARLAAALGITGALNRADVTRPESTLWVEPDLTFPDSDIMTGPRIGLGTRVLEPWRSIPWRFWVTGNPYISR